MTKYIIRCIIGLQYRVCIPALFIPPRSESKKEVQFLLAHPEQFLDAVCPVCQATLSVVPGLTHVLCPHCGAIFYVPDAIVPPKIPQGEGACMEESTKS